MNVASFEEVLKRVSPQQDTHLREAGERLALTLATGELSN